MNSNIKAFAKHKTLLLSSVFVQVLCTDGEGALGENFVSSSHYPSNVNNDFSEESTTISTTIAGATSTESWYYNNPWADISTGKIVTLVVISFCLPVGFMMLLFWRLQREKKYLNARAGALVYRETVLVPSFTVSDANNSSNSNADHFNVIQMHSTLYDTPPDYDEVIANGPGGNDTVKSKSSSKTDELPPPSYSTVYM